MRIRFFSKASSLNADTKIASPSVKENITFFQFFSVEFLSNVLPKRAFLFIVPTVLFIVLFLPSFSGDARFSYRDVAFYYYPLFQQIQNEWDQGRLPLWTPYVNLGQPLAADPTASVFYPLKLVFFLSSYNILSYGTCFKLYIWIHVAIAFILSYRLSRNLKISCEGALLGALTYTFSGQILFQYANVIYLVGAAWTPGIFSLALSFYREKKFRKKVKQLFKLGIPLSLTILGGEPQIVYLSILTLTIIFVFVHVEFGLYPHTIGKRFHLVNFQFFPRVVNAFAFTFFISIIVFCYSAIQILPSLEMVGRSQRTDKNRPSTIWEIPRLPCSNVSTEFDKAINEISYDELLCADFSYGGRSCSSYRFSVGPWRWLEFLFPNIGGRQFPKFSRWFNVFPEEVSVWTPTLYFGVFPFLLAISVFSFRYKAGKSNPFQVIGTWIVLISLLAGMGGFGLVWFFRAFCCILPDYQISASFSNYDPVGGVYWLLNTTLPYFSNFRYPAKLITLTMLGFSCLTGLGWDRKSSSSNLKNSLVFTIVVAFAGLIFISFKGKTFFSSIIATDPLFGQFQPSLAQSVVSCSFLHTIVVLSISLLLCHFISQKKIITPSRNTQILSFCLLAVTAADVYISNSWIIVVSPTSLFERSSDFSMQIEKEQKSYTRLLQPKVQNDRNTVALNEFNAVRRSRSYFRKRL